MVLLQVPEGTVELLTESESERRCQADPRELPRCLRLVRGPGVRLRGLTEVHFPASVKFVGQYAFVGCSSIKSLHFAEGLQAIHACAFLGCSGITAIHLPRSLRHIGAGAFSDCSGITSLRIPQRVRSIGIAAFQNCSGIVDLRLPEGLRSLGLHTFAGCTGLATLVLPLGLTDVGRDAADAGAFAGCTNLARVLAPDRLVGGDMDDPDSVFEGCPALASGLTPFSAVKPPRRRFWHPTMHAWCTPAARACVAAVLAAELRTDQQESPRLPSLPHELWLLILEFAPRCELGAAGATAPVQAPAHFVQFADMNDIIRPGDELDTEDEDENEDEGVGEAEDEDEEGFLEEEGGWASWEPMPVPSPAPVPAVEATSSVRVAAFCPQR